MNNNDILRSLRYVLNLRDEGLIAIAELANCKIEKADMAVYLKKEEEPGYRECPHKVMARILDGLIMHLRGKDETRPLPPIETPITNNIALKKLRVAFALKDSDLVAAIERPGVIKVSKAELTAFFRKPDHRNYRECGDQVLRNLLKGLSLDAERKGFSHA